MFSNGYLSDAQQIATQYEYDAALRRQRRWHPSGTRGFVVGVAAGILIGRKTAQREDRGPDSGRTPRGCF